MIDKKIKKRLQIIMKNNYMTIKDVCIESKTSFPVISKLLLEQPLSMRSLKKIIEFIKKYEVQP